MTCFSFIYADESLPRISPKGYNTSLSEDVVVFRCIVALDTFSVIWSINGVADDQLEEGQGITPNSNLVTEGDTTFATISVQARAENDNTTLECVAISPDLIAARSEGVLLQVQGIVFTLLHFLCGVYCSFTLLHVQAF